MNANDVIKIGRSRVRAARTAASQRLSPSSSACLANSTIKIAFFAARPMSTTKPICVRMLLSMPRSSRPLTAANRHIGTIRMTARGSRMLSYCASEEQKDEHHREGECNHRFVAGDLFLQGNLGPLEAKARWQPLGDDLFHGGDSLSGREAGR